MTKKILLIFFGIIFFIFTISSIDAALCKEYDGYYHDCYNLYYHYPKYYYEYNSIYINKYPIYHKISYYDHLDYYKQNPKIYFIRDDRDYEFFINTEKKFNIYLENPVINIKNYNIKSAKNCPEEFICIKKDTR